MLTWAASNLDTPLHKSHDWSISHCSPPESPEMERYQPTQKTAKAANSSSEAKIFHKFLPRYQSSSRLGLVVEDCIFLILILTAPHPLLSALSALGGQLKVSEHGRAKCTGPASILRGERVGGCRGQYGRPRRSESHFLCFGLLLVRTQPRLDAT